MGILRREAKGRGELVVEFVDMFVEGFDVEESVSTVVPGVFEDEEDCDLSGRGREGVRRGREGRSKGRTNLVGHCEEGGEGDFES